MARRRLVVVVMALVAVAIPRPASAADPTERTGLLYATHAGVPLRLDAYLPSGEGPHPGVVLLHGGSWTEGSRSDMAWAGRRFAREGFAAFSIDYRLAPRFEHPAALHDARAAVAWIRANASRFGVAPGRLSAFGTSAGGHLAAMLAVTGTGPLDRGTRVLAAVSWSGPMDLRTLPAEASPGDAAWLDRTVRRLVGCGAGPCSGPLRAASPITHVDADDGAVLIANATAEVVPFVQAERMADALEASAVPSRLVEVIGTQHAHLADWNDSRSRRSVWRASVSFLATWTAPIRPAAATSSGGSSGGLLAVIAGFLALLASVTATAEAPRLLGRRPSRRIAADGAALSLIDALARDGANCYGIETVVARGVGRAA